MVSLCNLKFLKHPEVPSKALPSNYHDRNRVEQYSEDLQNIDTKSKNRSK